MVSKIQVSLVNRQKDCNGFDYICEADVNILGQSLPQSSGDFTVQIRNFNYFFNYVRIAQLHSIKTF